MPLFFFAWRAAALEETVARGRAYAAARFSMGNFVHGAMTRQLQAMLESTRHQQSFSPLFADEIH
ncbi:hypothetical protein [Pseudoduganella sp. R-34]|uniref:hypothetical protein n=1 Tax=unclassified Pseudoduganella TaxID=2637179 RepID=UPI003CF94922